MRFAITGGAGFIGSQLAGELLREHEVVILDDLTSGGRDRIPDPPVRNRLTFLEGSVSDLALLRRAFEDVDGVFHLAALVSVPGSIADPLRSHEVNLSGTLNALIAARDAGARRFVFASSAAVYGTGARLPLKENEPPRPESPYAVAKLAGEHYCRLFTQLYGLSTISLRYFNVYGPGQDPSSPYAAVIPAFIRRLLEGERPVIHGDGLQTRDFIYVKDVVTANIRAMEGNAEGVFNIASGRATSILELAALLMELLSERLEPLFTPPRPGDIRHSVADTGRASEELGFIPRYSLEEGLRETISWYKRIHAPAARADSERYRPFPAGERGARSTRRAP